MTEIRTSEPVKRDAVLPWLPWSLAIGVVVAYTAIFVAWAFIAPFVHRDFASAGQFGDMFGALNAYVSGLAMLGVVAAVLFQRAELLETRGALALERRGVEAQISRWDKDYIERNKPVVFCDRVDLSAGGYEYVIRNVGGGFAVNVYFTSGPNVPDVHGSWPVRGLGSIGPNSERRLPDELNRGMCDSGNNPFGFLLIAEGPHSRTTQWTPTLNYRSADYDPREGHVQHRVATVLHPTPAFQSSSLGQFLTANAADLFVQLATMGGRHD